MKAHVCLSRCNQSHMLRNSRDNLNDAKTTDSENCLVCKDLLKHMGRFFNMLETACGSSESDWLTVNEIASELKVSKTIVYRLIRSGELEAANIVENNNKIAQKGHYRIKRESLNQYLESKKVKPFPNQVTRTSHSRRLPKVKNHLGL